MVLCSAKKKHLTTLMNLEGNIFFHFATVVYIVIIAECHLYYNACIYCLAKLIIFLCDYDVTINKGLFD